jgi:hypothetical protein
MLLRVIYTLGVIATRTTAYLQDFSDQLHHASLLKQDPHSQRPFGADPPPLSLFAAAQRNINSRVRQYTSNNASTLCGRSSSSLETMTCFKKQDCVDWLLLNTDASLFNGNPISPGQWNEAQTSVSCQENRCVRVPKQEFGDTCKHFFDDKYAGIY